MSFWGAAVIRNFLRIFPYIGDLLVFWLWGGFLVGERTLKLFLLGHFFVSLLIFVLILNHLISLHVEGSMNKLLITRQQIKTIFFPKFIVKDFCILLLFLIFFVFDFFCFVEEENFFAVDLVASHLHIKPEWYFLFLYRILRRVPRKIFGVILRGRFLLLFLALGRGFVKVLVGAWKKGLVFRFFFLGGVLRGLGGIGINRVSLFFSLCVSFFLFILLFLILF